MTDHRRRFVSTAVVALAIAVGILLVSAAISLYIVTVKAPTDLANNVAATMKSWFNFTPRVKIGETVVIEQQAPILELATISRGLFVDYSWAHTWLGSTKTLQLTGAFTVKAGFDLRESFELRVDKNPLRVSATLPSPRILSVQMDTFLVIRDENGWWNRITPDDRQTAVNQLRARAREKAELGGILDSTWVSAEQQVRKIVEWNGSTVEFIRRGAGK